eukprot:5498323-Amphidinium_carterae.1
MFLLQSSVPCSLGCENVWVFLLKHREGWSWYPDGLRSGALSSMSLDGVVAVASEKQQFSGCGPGRLALCYHGMELDAPRQRA